MSKKPVTKFSRKQLSQNLRDFREKANLTRDEVVNLASTGFARSSLQAWEDGEREPKLENINELAHIYNISPITLIFGYDEASYNEQTITHDNDTYDYVPVYDIQASAGHGMFTDGTTKPIKYLAFRKDWIAYRGLKIKDLAIIYAEGDSMEPTIPDGSTLVIDRSRNYPKDGKIYVIRIEDRLYVKRTQWLPSGLRLISDNKELYAPIDLTKTELEHENIEVVGQVIHTAHDLP